MLNVNLEIIEDSKYYSVLDARGNVTTVFVWGDDMYVQTNNSPARHIEDAKRLSKTAKALVDYVLAEMEAEESASESVEIANPRYSSFVSAHGEQPNWTYMAFINRMKVLFCGDLYGHVSNHDEFTTFIEANAYKFQVTS